MKHLINIFKQYKYELLLIYTYMLIAEGLLLLQPYFLGKTIDGLLVGNWNWLIGLVLVYAGSTMFIYKRMVYDTKVYTKIYNNIVMEFIHKTDVDNSSKVARTDMAHQIVDVLESYVHYYISVIVTVLGSLVFVMRGSLITGFIVLGCVFPIMFIVFKFYKKIKQATVVGNNQYEKKVDVINRSNKDEITSFFNRRRKLWIYGSTLQGKNWFWVNAVKYTFLVTALIVFIKTSDKLSQGDIIAMYSYISNFLVSLMSIPVGVEAYSRILDVLKRIQC
jgi:hypothetical protein